MNPSDHRVTIDAPVAIGGCGSSGTSLVSRMIDAHPEFACGPEMSVFDRPRMYEIPLNDLRAMYRRQEFEALEEGVPFPVRRKDDHTYHGLYGENSGVAYNSRAETEAIFEASVTVAEFWNRYFTHYARKEKASSWAEKTPNNVFCADRFLDWYPEGRFVHVVRNGRDVVLSLMDRRDAYPMSAILRWTSALEAAAEVRGHERYYEMHYEELVRRPEETLSDLFAWLGTELDEQVFEFYEKPSTSPYEYGTSPVHTNSLGRWDRTREQLSENLRELVKLTTRRHLLAYGYEPLESRSEPAVPPTVS